MGNLEIRIEEIKNLKNQCGFPMFGEIAEIRYMKRDKNFCVIRTKAAVNDNIYFVYKNKNGVIGSTCLNDGEDDDDYNRISKINEKKDEVIITLKDSSNRKFPVTIYKGIAKN